MEFLNVDGVQPLISTLFPADKVVFMFNFNTYPPLILITLLIFYLTTVLLNLIAFFRV